MTTALAGKWIIAYGLFLIVCGVAGFLSNPEKARTALMSGGTAGGLSLVWGFLALRGFRWSVVASLVMTTLLAGVFVWRSTVGWQAYLAGQSEKLFAAALISTMLAGSLVLIAQLARTLWSGSGRTTAPARA